mgnify:CR=1 FL=1
MSEFFGLLFSAVLANNLALSYLVGLDLQVAASRRISTAWLIGLSNLYCLTLCLPAVYILDQLIIAPLQLQYLDLLFYLMLILLIVYASKNLFAIFFPLLSQQLEKVIPLLLLNSLLFAVILLDNSNSFTGALLYGFSSGTGFLFLLLVITCLRERIDNEAIPLPFQGLPILLISLGIFSMGLMGLAGI